MKRRTFISAAANLGAAANMGAMAAAARMASAAEQTASVPDAIKNLRPMTAGVVPITDAERRARVEKARRLMRENSIGAVVMEAGSSVYYFTGVRAAAGAFFVLPQKGEPAWFTAKAAEARMQPLLPSSADFRVSADTAALFPSVAQFLKDRGAAPAAGGSSIGMEERTSFGTFDALRNALPGTPFVSADPVTVGCRVIKSPAEIALMQHAADVTIACYKAVFSTFREGMTNTELSANVGAAYRALGYRGDALIIFGKYTAFPHGSVQPQQLHEGDIVLVDDGCTVEGYQSDITRTTVFGKPTARQREIWNLERKAQDAALAAARPGATCESVDAAARKVITDAGFGPGYKVPGLPHRTGHGIGLDGHEWTYLVRGNKTKIEPGMCFSNEPTIAIYGEFGIRLEDCMYITESGARMFSRQSPAVDQPFG
jgi:Xaa-Pro dipeptidase